MNLNFMINWPKELGGDKTNFPEKILAGFKDTPLNENICQYMSSEFFDPNFDLINCRPKIHTIRKGKRCKKGDKIHMQVWQGKPRRSKVLQFMPVLECTGVEDIIIDVDDSGGDVFINNNWIGGFTIGDDFHDEDVMKLLSDNDGIDSGKLFSNYFNQTFDGQIIHWTNFKYT